MNKTNQPILSDNSKKSIFKLKWNKNDKLTLLKTLKKYGHKDITLISKMLPNIPPGVIKAVINRFLTKSRTTPKSAQPPINNWLQCSLFGDRETLIPQALRFIYLFEKHPPLSKSNKCDFRAIYNFLYHLTRGDTPQELPPKTKEILYTLLTQVINEVWPKSQGEVLEYLGKIYNKRKIIKVYPGKRKNV